MGRRDITTAGLALAAVCVLQSPSQAGEPVASAAPPASSLALPAAAIIPLADPAGGEVPPCDCLVIPALTPVKIELVEAVSSKTSVTGAMFKIALQQPISVGGVDLVPAGTPGVGEVVHAKKSGGSGAGGELVIAGRYLDFGGQRIRLRSMMVSSTGKDQTTLAMASAQAISFFAFAIRGKNTDLPAGSIADAKVAELAWIPRPPPALKPSLPASEPAAATNAITPIPTTIPTGGN